MYRVSLPRCTIAGDVDPVTYSHFISGAVPRKCGGCKHLFEGGCTRAMEQTKGYLSLDHGACPIKGATNPVLVETQYFTSKVYVPSKCERCRNLKLDSIRGFVCDLDRKLWGEFPRTLDWGSWTPEHPNLRLNSGRSVCHQVHQAVAARDEVQAIKAFRSSHNDATLREARDAYAELVLQVDPSAG